MFLPKQVHLILKIWRSPEKSISCLVRPGYRVLWGRWLGASARNLQLAWRGKSEGENTYGAVAQVAHSAVEVGGLADGGARVTPRRVVEVGLREGLLPVGRVVIYDGAACNTQTKPRFTNTQSNSIIALSRFFSQTRTHQIPSLTGIRIGRPCVSAHSKDLHRICWVLNSASSENSIFDAMILYVLDQRACIDWSMLTNEEETQIMRGNLVGAARKFS